MYPFEVPKDHIFVNQIDVISNNLAFCECVENEAGCCLCVDFALYISRSIRDFSFQVEIIIIIIIIIIIFIIIIIIIYFNFLPSVVKIPMVKNIKLKSNLKWLTFDVIPIDEGASESNLIKTLD